MPDESEQRMTTGSDYPSQTVTCNVCDVVVEAHQLNSHKRDFHQKTVTIRISGRPTITLHRIEGVFNCPTCSSYSHFKPRTVRKHVLMCSSDSAIASANEQSDDSNIEAGEPVGDIVSPANGKYLHLSSNFSVIHY